MQVVERMTGQVVRDLELDPLNPLSRMIPIGVLEEAGSEVRGRGVGGGWGCDHVHSCGLPKLCAIIPRCPNCTFGRAAAGMLCPCTVVALRPAMQGGGVAPRRPLIKRAGIAP